MHPKVCPVCGGDSIKAIPRTAVKLRGETHAVEGVLAYRCGKGHIFMSPPDKKRRSKK